MAEINLGTPNGVAGADPTEPLQPEKSIGDLVAQVSSDFADLVHTQIELAKVELKDEATRAAKGAGMVGGAGVVGYLAVALLSFAAAHGLGEIMPISVGFLLVGLVWAAVAAVLAMRGKAQLKTVEPIPTTQQTLKEDVQWARQQAS
jgi:uncharacterized membrane protein YqjE